MTKNITAPADSTYTTLNDVHPNKGECGIMDKKSTKLRVQCNNVFKDVNNIRTEFNKIWLDIIKTLENNNYLEYNDSKDVQSHARRKEVSEE